jgi:hypothetical protein
MASVLKYRFMCLPTGGSTAGNHIHYIWDTTTPTHCPERNNLHHFDLSSITVVDRVEETIVRIKEEDIPTGGRIQVLGKQFEITCATGESQIFNFSLPISVNLSSVSIPTYENQRGDYFDFLIAPDTTIGILSESAATGATSIVASQTVIDNIEDGFFITFTDGVNTVNGGQVSSINTETNTVSFETPLTTSFSNMSPTFIKMTVKLGHNIYLGYGSMLRFGDDKVGSSYIPAGTPIRMVYYNMSGNTPKYLTAFGSYMY